ncbi:AAA family ATPase [Embleya sp. NPDC059259]|uniref:helix-turn-helix transcriptional regulator n=2 Tax=Embleya TaxID=2699295 RepID=UPI0036C3539D
MAEAVTIPLWVGSRARPAPFTGRHGELAAVATLLAGVRDGRSCTLVLAGEPGVGKTRLLDRVAETAGDLRVVRTAGVESEARLGFASLYRLLRPLLTGLDALPAPQREALRSAFGLFAGPPADRYLVGMACLTLLAGAALEQPLLCLVDDLQWLDRESSDALAFAARRLHADAIGLILAGRDEPAGPGPFDGIAALRLDGLPGADAGTLLRAAVPGRLAPAMAARIVADTGGNPLALIEIAGTLAPEHLAGTTPLHAPLPVGARLESHFSHRIGALPAETRALLLLLSAAPSEDSLLLWRAAGVLGIPATAADAAVSAGILTPDDPTGFRHPLIRSAVYRGADAADRRRVHETLAALSDPARDPVRRAWHRAEATIGLDDEVAAELAAAAERVRVRGGYAEQAALLSRAAQLSADGRPARLIEAARAYLVAGDPDAAQAILDRAMPLLGPGDPVLHARAVRAGATIDLCFARIAGVPPLLLDAARSIADAEPALARKMLFEGMHAILLGNHSSLAPRDFGGAVLGSPAMRPEPSTAEDLLLKGFAVRVHVGHPASVPILRRALHVLCEGPDIVEDGLPLAVLAGYAADELWDDAGGYAANRRLEEHERGSGALSALWTTLLVRSTWEQRAGRFAAAAACIDESEELAALVGLPQVGPAHRIDLLAWSGREAETRAAADVITRHWVAEKDHDAFGDWARNCLTVLEIGHGRYAEALALARITFAKDNCSTAARVAHDVVEAGVRCGDHRAAKDALTRLEERATAAGTPWALGLLARCRALMADDDHAEALYLESVELLGRTRVATELARSRLLYGEWLRRCRRRGEARVELRTAYEMFAGMGAAGFAERARVELLATGEHARKRDSRGGLGLTPQERRVAELAAGGTTNTEIAARLFITTSTVEYHLNKVFRRLGITSRRQLKSVLDDGAADA